MIDEDVISDAFDKAVERRHLSETNNDRLSVKYWDGVAAALGWVIEQYEENPSQ